jgi:hypothetical protein
MERRPSGCRGDAGLNAATRNCPSELSEWRWPSRAPLARMDADANRGVGLEETQAPMSTNCSPLTSAPPPTAVDLDQGRRARLRAFLVDRRSRLTPADVGLPETHRRRVPGLRRDEVAELMGVSCDWYRWFEGGRPIRVSVPFLAKLARVLRLSPLEQIGLYHLAFPEIYEAYMAQRHITIPLLVSEDGELAITAA